MLLVSKSDALVRILPTSLRFWEKLGLRPRIGDKNVVAFAFFEASDDDREAEIAEWINAVSAAYTVRRQIVLAISMLIFLQGEESW